VDESPATLFASEFVFVATADDEGWRRVVGVEHDVRGAHRRTPAFAVDDSFIEQWRVPDVVAVRVENHSYSARCPEPLPSGLVSSPSPVNVSVEVCASLRSTASLKRCARLMIAAMSCGLSGTIEPGFA
jgi:hypothetical protein